MINVVLYRECGLVIKAYKSDELCRKTYIGYSKRDAISLFRKEFNLKNKKLNIIDLTKQYL